MTGVSLFSYGTLRDPAVQIAHFGRTLTGRPDRLGGFTRSEIASDGAVYPILIPRGEAPELIEGLVFDISEADLAAADLYEGDAYRRLRVELDSGARAWVYVAA